MVVRRALGITGISQAAIFVLGFANVVIVSRLLRPEEIGIFSVAVSVLGFAHIFREFGVGQYLVQAAQVGKAELRAAFTVTLASSWLIALLIFLLRYPLSSFYGHEGVAEVLLVVCLNFLVLPLGSAQMAMMKRELRFGAIAGIGVAAAAVQTLVTIACAYVGQSYLSMAWGSLAMHLTSALAVNVLRAGHGPTLPTLHGLPAVLKFGSLTSASALIREIGLAAPDLILGRTLGFADVAVFSRGQGLQKMLVQRINALVRHVHFPTLASQLRKGGDATALFFQATNHLSAVTLPLLAVLAALSEPLILFVFGEQWEAAVPVAVYICIGRMLMAPYALYALTLMAAGKLYSELWAESFALLARIAVLLSSIWLPLDDVVRLLLIAFLLEAYSGQRALKRALGIGFGMMLRRLWKAAALVPFACLGPLLVLWLAASAGIAQDHRLGMLVAGGMLALMGWSVGVYVLDHPMKGEIARLLASTRRLLRRRN